MRFLLVILAVLIAGCGDAERPEAPAAQTAPPNETASEVPPETMNGATGETATSPDAPATSSGLPSDLSGLDLQANHPSGSVLRVTGVRFANDHIATDIEFTNGHEREQMLNQHRNNQFVIRDNLGNVYNVSPPPNNNQVAVPGRQTISGEFVFLGRLHPDATSLTLITNERHGSDSHVTNSPRIRIDIPIS